MGNHKSKIKIKKKISYKETNHNEISANDKEIEYAPPSVIDPNPIIPSK